LVVQPDAGKGDGIVYSLNGEPDPEAGERLQGLDPGLLIFARTPITWQEWVTLWQSGPGQEGPAPYGFVLGNARGAESEGAPEAAGGTLATLARTKAAINPPVSTLGSEAGGEEKNRNGSR
jgi:hypothetical protein